MVRIRLTVFLLLLPLGACTRQRASLGVGGELSGTIRAGEALTFAVDVAPGHVANVLIHQHEIDIAVESGGVISDSTEWDYESLHVAAPSAVKLIAAKDGPKEGRFRIRFVTQRQKSDLTNLAIRAAEVEAAGREQLDKRTSESLQAAALRLREAKELWKRVGDLRREAHATARLGIASEHLGRYSDADEHYHAALAQLKTAEDETAALVLEKTWMNLGGRFGEERADIRTLEDRLRRAHQSGDRRVVALFTKSLGSAYGKLKNHAEDERMKRQHLELARGLGDVSMQAEALGRLGALALSQQNFSESMSFAYESLRLAQKIGSDGEEIAALGLIATGSGYMHDFETAARTFEALRDANSRRGDHGSAMLASLTLAGINRSRNRPAAAWKNLNDARLVLERIRGPVATVSERFVGPAEAEFAVFLAQMAGQFPEYAIRAFAATDSIRGIFMGSATGDHYGELQEALGNETTLIEYVAQPQHNESEYVWLDTKAQTLSLKTNHFKATLGTLESAVASLSDPKASLEASLESRKLLSKVYLAPLKGRLHTKRIVIVPDESMVRIPFALLPHPDYSDGSLLGDHHVVTYAPSGQAIVSRPKETRKPAGERVLLAGDPVTNLRDSRMWSKSATAPQPDDWIATARAAGVLVDGSQLARLGFAKQETDSISKELGNRKVTKLLGFDANREQVLSASKEAEYLHLISHGLADLLRPRGSGLAFSFWDREGAPQDGFLRFEEIARMKIHAKIVTLSACDTSVGKVLSHYSVPSLSNAFLHAGARRVVSTLWKVDDAATAALMPHFYRNLFTKKMLPGEALWLAQMEIRKQPRWNNPYYWAGFALSGDWRPL